MARIQHARRYCFTYEWEFYICYEDYLLPDMLYGSEFESVFHISWGQFDQIITKIMDEVELGIYQDVGGRQDKAKLLSWGNSIIPPKALAFGIPILLLNTFRFPSHSVWDCIRILMIDDSCVFEVPDETDLKNIIKLHRDVHCIDDILGFLHYLHTIWNFSKILDWIVPGERE